MKKIIALIAALAMVLSLTGCFGTGNQSDSTADEANAADVSTYDKDIDGLAKYITDRNKGASKQEILGDIVYADNAVRVVLNGSGNPIIEIYDYSSIVDPSATPDSADPEKAEKAQAILDSIKDKGKFTTMDGNGIEMTAVITKSGKYVVAWDESRSFKYTENIATDELKENW